MRRVSPCHTNAGWKLQVVDHPWWALAWESFYNAALTALGSPCCHYTHGSNGERRSWAGWIYDHLPENESLRGRFDVAQYCLIQNRLTSRYWGKTVLSIPISKAEAAALNPEFVESCAYLDEPAPTFTITTASNSYITGTSSVVYNFTNG